MSQPVLEARGLRKSFGAHEVLAGIDLTVAAGEAVCILGPSGSGKSTLLRGLNWLEPPDGGSVFLMGQRVGVRPGGNIRMSDRELSQMRTRTLAVACRCMNRKSTALTRASGKARRTSERDRP